MCRIAPFRDGLQGRFSLASSSSRSPRACLDQMSVAKSPLQRSRRCRQIAQAHVDGIAVSLRREARPAAEQSPQRRTGGWLTSLACLHAQPSPTRRLERCVAKRRVRLMRSFSFGCVSVWSRGASRVAPASRAPSNEHHLVGHRTSAQYRIIETSISSFRFRRRLHQASCAIFGGERPSRPRSNAPPRPAIDFVMYNQAHIPAPFNVVGVEFVLDEPGATEGYGGTLMARGGRPQRSRAAAAGATDETADVHGSSRVSAKACSFFRFFTSRNRARRV